MTSPNPLHPIFDRVLTRAQKEAGLGQRARVIWLYGLSGSGKSTLANALERTLHGRGVKTALLDGDNLRTGLNQGLGFSDEDRTENLRRAAEAARLFLDAGIVVIASFISPLRRHRQAARQIIGPDDFIEVHVSAPYEVCATRDPKGLYAKAGSGAVKAFTGRDSSFEPPSPEDGALLLDTATASVEACLTRLLERVDPAVRP